MDEEINLAKLGEQSWKMSPARAFDVFPSIRKAVPHCYADLLSQRPIQRRKVDAEQSAFSVSFECFQKEARSHPVRNACLHYLVWLQMTSQTPKGSNKSCVAVVPLLEAHRASLNPTGLQLIDNFGP